MNLFPVIAFLLMAAGGFLLLGISPKELALSLAAPIQRRRPTLRKRIREVTHPKKLKGIRRTVREARDVLEITGRGARFGLVCILSLASTVLGMMIALALDNVLMLPVLAVGCALLPFWYILFTSISFKKQLAAELETALSVVTTSYLRSESIITAVEENLDYLNPPVAQVFEGFLAQSKLISSNVSHALESMKGRLHNEIYDEWLDAVIACQEDKMLKTTLAPIVGKLSDVRVVSAELDYLLYEPVKEFVTMAVLLIGNIPLLYFLNKSWFDTLLFTTPGKAILAICALALFAGAAAVIRLTRPIEYRR